MNLYVSLIRPHVPGLFALMVIAMLAGLSVSVAVSAQAENHTQSQAEIDADSPAATIRQQLSAFRNGDFMRAFSFASPTIQFLLSTPGNFENMVRNRYPMVVDPAQTRMLDRFVEEGKTFQQVELIDDQGKSHLLEYEMLLTDRGWKINGVRFARPALWAI